MISRKLDVSRGGTRAATGKEATKIKELIDLCLSTDNGRHRTDASDEGQQHKNTTDAQAWNWRPQGDVQQGNIMPAAELKSRPLLD